MQVLNLQILLQETAKSFASSKAESEVYSIYMEATQFDEIYKNQRLAEIEIQSIKDQRNLLITEQQVWNILFIYFIVILFKLHVFISCTTSNDFFHFNETAHIYMTIEDICTNLYVTRNLPWSNLSYHKKLHWE